MEAELENTHPLDSIANNVCNECSTLFDQMRKWYENELDKLRDELARANNTQERTYKSEPVPFVEQVFVACDHNIDVCQEVEPSEAPDVEEDRQSVAERLMGQNETEHGIKIEPEDEDISMSFQFDGNIKNEQTVDFDYIDDDFDMQTIHHSDNYSLDDASTAQEHNQPSSAKTYICTISNCNTSFTSVRAIRNHKHAAHWKESTLEKKFFCTHPGCGLGFPYNSRLAYHIARAHSEISQPNACNEPGCRKVYKRLSDLEAHKLRHNITFACTIPECYRTYKTEHGLRKHTEKHGSSEYKCQTTGCNEVFTTARDIRNHKLEMHFSTPPNNKFMCTHPGCTQGFPYVSRLLYHKRTVHEGQPRPIRQRCNVAGCDKLINNLRVHMIIAHGSKNTFECTMADCGKTFFFQNLLDRHMRRHLGLDPFVCNISNCGATFQSDKEFVQHKIIIHKRQIATGRPNMRFKCSEADCGKLFAYRSRLIQHRKYVHGGQTEALVCNVPNCGRSYQSKGEYKRHMYKHLDNVEHNFLCTDCGKTFIEKRALASHMKTHTERERAWLCDEPDCGKSFQTEHVLRTHKVIHSDERRFKCDVDGCGKMFKRKASLSIHQVVHTRARPYSCTYLACGTTFNTSSLLRRHLKVVHWGQRPFVCDVAACGKAFPYLCKLNMHAKTHTKAE